MSFTFCLSVQFATNYLKFPYMLVRKRPFQSSPTWFMYATSPISHAMLSSLFKILQGTNAGLHDLVDVGTLTKFYQKISFVE